MKMLIAGANGFLGRNLCHEFLNNAYEVDGLVHSHVQHVPKNVKCFTLHEIVALRKPYDLIILCSGNFQSSYEDLYASQVILPQQIVEHFPDSKILFLSSVAVYGVHTRSISLNSSFHQPDAYGLAKLAGEFIVRKHKHSSIIRLSNIYGVGMNTSLFIWSIIQSAMKKKTITVFGDGSRLQDYVYIKDAVSLCVNVSKKSHPDIVLGVYGRSFSNTYIAETIAKIIGNVSIKYTGKDTAPSYVYSVQAEKQIFSPKYSLQKGLTDMIKQML